jgi:hypothetical protein
MQALEPVAYRKARCLIYDGDLLFWRPTNLCARAIALFTSGPYSHVASVSWAHGVLESHEMLQFHGGRPVNLSALVRQSPGGVDVYRRCADHAQRHRFCVAQRRRAGEPYGWWDIVGIAGQTLDHGKVTPPWRRTLAEARHDPELWRALYSVPIGTAAFCSQAVISDLRAAGIDDLPDLAAWQVSPNRLAGCANYQFTLVS